MTGFAAIQKHVAGIPLQRRLIVRQAVPIAATLVGLLGLLLAAGYFFARGEVLAGVQRQATQLADSISHYDMYYRSWFATSAAPLVRIFEAAGPDLPPAGSPADEELGRRASQMLGQREIIVRTVDERGVYRVRRWAPASGDAGETAAPLFENPEQTRTRLKTTLAAIGNTPGWHAPTDEETGQEREARMRYSAPLRHGGKDGVFGVLTLTVAMSWFEDRVKAFRGLEGCAVFLLAPDGRWNLPEAMDRAGFAPQLTDGEKNALERMRAAMLARESGVLSFSLGHKRFIAVSMPLSIPGFMLGVLIPRARLLEPLDTLAAVLCLAGGLAFCLALFSLYRANLRMLRPLVPLGVLAEHLAKGNAGAPGTLRPAGAGSYPDEPARLTRAAERLRHALAERVRDLTLLAVTRERLQGELRLARTIQEGLLPEALPTADDVAFSAWLEPARDVCGDMYDCFFTSPDTLCCLMGNAAARGVPAALLMGRVMPLLRELLHTGLPPSRALENANRVISGYPPVQGKDESLFVSVFAGILDRRSGQLTWASAGQRPPFTTWDEILPWSKDMPLGLQPDAGYQERETVVPPGGLLFFCNERLLAAPDASGTMFGEERVTALLREPAGDPAATVRAVRAAVLAHCGGRAHEDLAMLALLRRGTAP